MSEPDLEFANDLLRGADQIAEFIFGSRMSRRKVYYLAERTRLPVFRLASVLCARKSVLLLWIKLQEEHHGDTVERRLLLKWIKDQEEEERRSKERPDTSETSITSG
jgi:hypothetical protein